MEDHVVKCPACIEGMLKILTDQINVPHFGDVMISTLICPRCGYRSSDIIPLNNLPPNRFILKIDRPEVMNIRVVRSGSSTVRIPEIGARIDPGLFSEGYVTNAEGILKRFEDILFQLLRDLTTFPEGPDISDRIEKTRELLERIGAFINGTIKEGDYLTLIIEDPLGNSAIISDEDDLIKIEPLTEKEILEMMASKKEKDDILDL